MKSNVFVFILIFFLGCFYADLPVFCDEDISVHTQVSDINQAELETLFADKQSFKTMLKTENLTLEYLDEEKNTLLHLSIVYGNRDIFTYLLEADVNINQQNKWGTTPLHTAIHYHENAMAKELIAIGANMEIEDSKHQTPLILAYKKQNWDTFGALLQAGASVQSGYHSEYKMYYVSRKIHFFYTIVRNDKAWRVYKEKGAFDFQFTQYGDVYDPLLNDEPTPMHLLLEWRENEKVIQVLHEHQDLVNIVNGYGVPLLHMAAEQGNEELVHLLIKYNANRQLVDDAGNTLLHMAAAGNLLFLIKQELERGVPVDSTTKGGTTPLHYAVQNRHYKAVSLLQEKGADIEAETHIGCSPLYLAVQSGYPQIVGLLLEQGADVNHGNDWGATPVHFSALYQQASVLSMLLKYNPEIDKKNNRGETALFYAARSHCERSSGNRGLMMLLEAGYSVDVRDIGGQIPLYAAVEANRAVAVAVLIERGSPVDTEDSNGRTPLYWALLKKKYKMAELLLKIGCDIDYRNISGQTALHKAVYHKNIDAVKFLLEHGASRHIKDVQGKLPIDYAERENIKEILEN